MRRGLGAARCHSWDAEPEFPSEVADFFDDLWPVDPPDGQHVEGDMTALPPLHDLYQKHRARALAVVRRIVKDADDAEDVVQDVFVRLYARDAQFDGRAACTTWLHRILINSSINSLRAKKRRGRLETPLGLVEDPEVRAVGNERHALLLAALQHLSEQHRLVVTLRDVRGYSYPDIARMLGLPEGTVKSALNRGRTRLARVMAESDPDASAQLNS